MKRTYIAAIFTLVMLCAAVRAGMLLYRLIVIYHTVLVYIPSWGARLRTSTAGQIMPQRLLVAVVVCQLHIGFCRLRCCVPCIKPRVRLLLVTCVTRNLAASWRHVSVR